MKLFEVTLKNLDNFEEKVKGNKKLDMNTLYNKTKYQKKKIIPDILYNTIMNTKVEDKSIKFRGFVAIFDIKSPDFPLYDVKIMQTICANYGFHVSKIVLSKILLQLDFRTQNSALFQNKRNALSEGLFDEK